jgi:hypothetical protein
MRRNAALNNVCLATELLKGEILLRGSFANEKKVHTAHGYHDGTKKY